MSLIQEISRVLAESRVERLKMIVALLAGLLSIGVSFYQAYEKAQFKKESLTFESQMETLTEVQKSINNLSTFVATQKEQLRQSEEAINSLKKEEEALKPMVNADRDVVDSILRLQAERAASSAWQERLIGFGLGIVGSLIASLIWSGFRRGKSV
ncbi:MULTISPECIES: hypothetical protein [Aeromonas]|uniref:hypothetical protein n=2 Tax=Aeromonadaceae TaxID=84642 RepID=UPI001CCAA58C|nr:hypothetical protein [Aeromonas hydrophila]UBQ50801.1 hypothetical protein LCH17_01350 [Aeromonas hydrophila]HDI1213721.1 hypothetical protein [Aeromonas hydrophila]